MRALFRMTLVVVVVVPACHDVDRYAPCRPGTVLVGGACIQVPSCVGIADNCGPHRDENCCESAPVGGGYFQRGYDSGGTLQNNVRVPDQQPANGPAVKVSAFSFDRYEITVGRFRSFLASYDTWKNNAPHNGDGQDPNRPAPAPLPGGGVSLEVWDGAWNNNANYVPPSRADFVRRIGHTCGITNSPTGAPGDWTDDPGALENHPMTCITWFEALMFCIWDGGRLPTEAEWEFAAGAGNEQRAFPWSSPASDTSAPPDRANYQLAGGAGQLLAVVGSLPLGIGAFLQYDLAGNAYEWTMDSPQSLTAYDSEQIEPLDVSGDGTQRITRGGSYEYSPAFARTSARKWAANTSRYNDLGARCARGN